MAQGMGALHGSVMTLDLAFPEGVPRKGRQLSSRGSWLDDDGEGPVAVFRTGPAQYSRSMPYTSVGSWRLTRALLGEGGWRVVELPWYEWQLMAGGGSSVSGRDVGRQGGKKAGKGTKGGEYEREGEGERGRSEEAAMEEASRAGWVLTKLADAGVLK